MKPHYFLNAVFFASVVLGSAFVYAEQNQNSALPSREKKATRSPASIRLPENDSVTMRPMGPPRGQGEQMLDDLTTNDAPYLHRKSPRVFVAGVCRTANAAYYQTGQAGYADCLENGGYPTNSASSVAAGQRRAGAALLIPIPQ